MSTVGTLYDESIKFGHGKLLQVRLGERRYLDCYHWIHPTKFDLYCD